MASTLASLIVKIGADVTDLNRATDSVDKSVQRLGGRMQRAGRSMSAFITAPLVGLGAIAVKSAADLESLEIGLTAVTGSAEEAGRQMARLRELSRLPGLGFEQAVQGSINLQSAGFSAEQSEASLRAFGNALATVGKGSADLDGVVTALTQIASKGVISAEEINQLAERLPQIRTAMKDAFGTSNTEELQKMGIEATAFVAAITAEFAKLPPAANGAANTFTNLADTSKQLAAVYGEVLLPVVLKIANGMATFAEFLMGIPAPARELIVVVTGLVAAMGPLLIAVGTALKLWPLLQAAFVAITGPIGLTVAAIVGLTTVWMIWGDDIKRITQQTVEVIRTWLVDRFNAVVDSVKQKIDAVTGAFRGMYDAVVGHSYVPDMIDGIAAQFARLDAVMVTPAMAAIAKVNGGFAAMHGPNLSPVATGGGAGGAASSAIMGILTGGKDAKGILGGIGSSLLGGLGLAGPGGIIGSIGLKIATPLASKLADKLKNNIVNSFFGGGKKSEPAARSAYAQAPAAMASSGGVQGFRVDPMAGARFQSSTVNHFTISQQPGQDSLALSKQLEEMMDRRERQRGLTYAGNQYAYTPGVG